MKICKYQGFRLATVVLLQLGTGPLARAQFPWPVTPFNQSQQITGNFSEFRDTESADHFHNGTDIPKPDGSPVYPVKDGVVTGLVRTGSNAYVRVQDLAYVHISPSPSLGVGDSVFTSQSILGTILPGLGHVHFTNGYVGAERNSMLAGTGLTPFIDTWAPIIRYIRFFQNNSNAEFAGAQVMGPIDIVVKVDEQNGPPSSALSRRNNGTYSIGYKIYTSDTSSIVYQLPNDGIRFRFNTKPSNSYVHRVFHDQLSSTTSHVYIVTNNVSSDNFWNTGALPPDDYVVMAFTSDTRGNTDTLYQAVEVLESDVTPPDPPQIKFVRTEPNDLIVSWLANADPGLNGFRLRFSFDNITWSPRLDESDLQSSSVDTNFQVSLNRPIYFYLTSVDNALIPNESLRSDIYGASNVQPEVKILIVDGFDRMEGGSWQLPWHDMVFYYGSALSENGYGFDSVSNDAIVSGEVSLIDYHVVFWLLGDEADADETFSMSEQALVESFLQSGGNLFISGSEIAWDLDPDSDSPAATPSDESFLQEYLHADYAGKKAAAHTATGISGSIFDGLTIDFGSAPYEVESPDYLIPVGDGAIASLRFDESSIAAVQFDGIWAGSPNPGKLVFFGFPFETITSDQVRLVVMERILEYFIPTTNVAENKAGVPQAYILDQNYPNPFNPQTKLSFGLPAPSWVSLEVFNSLGQKIVILAQGFRPAGQFTEIWRGLDGQLIPVTSGIYFARLIAESGPGDEVMFEKTIRMTITR